MVRLIPTFISILLFSCDLVTSEDCPLSLPSKCFCGEEIHEGKSFKTVRCAALQDSDRVDKLASDLPKDTEMLIMTDSSFGFTDNRQLFPKSKSLRIARLENCEIEYFDLVQFLCAHPNLEELYLQENVIVWVHLNAKCSRNLRVLDLRQNHIHFLPNDTLSALEELGKLKIDMTDNTFTCDCNLRSTVEWLQMPHKSSATIIGVNTYRCADGFPEGMFGRYVIDVDPAELRCQAPLIPSTEGLKGNYLGIGFMAGFLFIIVLVIGIFTVYPYLKGLTEDMRHVWSQKSKIINSRNYITLQTETEA